MYKQSSSVKNIRKIYKLNKSLKHIADYITLSNNSDEIYTRFDFFINTKFVSKVQSIQTFSKQIIGIHLLTKSFVETQISFNIFSHLCIYHKKYTLIPSAYS